MLAGMEDAWMGSRIRPILVWKGTHESGIGGYTLQIQRQAFPRTQVKDKEIHVSVR